MSTTSTSNGICIVCAGLGRTGTMSLTLALEQLGFRPYHYVHPNHAELWESVVKGGASVQNIMERIVEDGYNVVVENPSSDVYEEILCLYPEAKVILTIRDDPSKFEKSWKTLMDTMVVTEQPFSFRFPSFFGWVPLFRRLREIRYFMGTTHLGLPAGMLTHGWRKQPEGWLGAQYDRHNKHVQETLSSDQLLVFNVKEGWAPLCQFLGCPVPQDEPFPHSRVNDTSSLMKLKQAFTVITYAWIPVTLAMFGAVGLGVSRLRSRR